MFSPVTTLGVGTMGATYGNLSLAPLSFFLPHDTVHGNRLSHLGHPTEAQGLLPSLYPASRQWFPFNLGSQLVN